MKRNRLKDYLLFNREILIGATCAFFTSAITSQLITKFTSTLTNSLISQIADMSVFLIVFGILFYRDNKHRFIVYSGFAAQKKKRIEFARLKWVLVELASTISVAEIEYNTVKPYFQYWFLNKGYEPFIASMIASSITIVGYLAVVDVMAYLTGLFKEQPKQG
jgi:hypothetical protein